MVAPYQVMLDDGKLIFAPQDDDRLIRGEHEFERLVAAAAASTTSYSATYDDGDDDDHTVTMAYRERVLQGYPQKHPELFDPANLQRFLMPTFADALRSATPDAAIRSLWVEESRGLYSLQMLTDEFCTWLLDECMHFEAWCLANAIEVHRPNTMNNHGAILDDFGVRSLLELARLPKSPLLSSPLFSSACQSLLAARPSLFRSPSPHPHVRRLRTARADDGGAHDAVRAAAHPTCRI